MLVFVHVGLRNTACLTSCLVYRWPLPGVGVWSLGSPLGHCQGPEYLHSLSPQRPLEYKKVIWILAYLDPFLFSSQLGSGWAGMSWRETIALG